MWQVNKELDNFNDQFKINKIINKFLLIGEKFMSELHLKQLGFIYLFIYLFIYRGTFTKHHGRVQKFRETGNLKDLFRNELDRACFADDPAY